MALGILDNLRVGRLVDQVLAAPSTEDPKVRAALERLREIGKPAIQPLIDALDTTSKEQTEVISQALLKLVNNSTLPEFVKGLAEGRPRVINAVASILRISEAFDPNLLIDLFGDPEISKTALIEILEGHKEQVNPDQLLRQAYKLDVGNQNALFRVIDDIVTEKQIPELISRLSGKDENIRAHIARTLGRFDGNPAVVEALERLAADRNRLVRLEAVRSLTGMKEADVSVHTLIALLRDPDIRIQDLAIEALIRKRDPQTVELLIDPLQDEDEYVRRGAVEVLNEVADTDSIKDLLVAIKDRDWWVRERAADALAKIGGPRVVDAMLELIKDPNKFVRRTAIEIINSSKDPRTLDYLINMLEDEDWWVRERAVDALGQLGNRRAVEPLIALAERDEKARAVVLHALGQIGDTSVARKIVPFLRDQNPEVQKEALNALALLTDEVDADDINEAIFAEIKDAPEEVQDLATRVVKQITERHPLSGSMEREASAESLERVRREYGMDKEASEELVQHGSTAETQEMESIVRDVRTGQVFNLELLKPGELIGDRYQFIRRIGKGAFGTVLLVNDTFVNEQIVLKFINTQMASDESAIKRFVHELRFTRKITHPNVIRIFDLLTFGDWQAISMEYFESHTLSKEIKDSEGGMDIQQALRELVQICAGMEAAHKEGVIHRDMKPPNILVNDEGLVKVVDFGIAAAARHNETRLTRTGTLVGTPTYIAPEQVLGKPVDNRTDIYSLGVIMYEMLTGKPPYQGEDYMSLMYQHVQGNAPLVSEIRPEIPKTLAAVVRKAMSVEPEKRYQSMGELRKRLEMMLE
ncbi:MAG: serine/threonine protein kinase [Gammaproteobacteria bacterium]|nr:MAG: serine/threonine protein kinase [Gammaproteobacteria bacterium]